MKNIELFERVKDYMIVASHVDGRTTELNLIKDLTNEIENMDKVEAKLVHDTRNLKLSNVKSVENISDEWVDLRTKVTKIISRGMEDTRTVVESIDTRCAADLNAVLDNTTNEILKIIDDEKTREFSRKLN